MITLIIFFSGCSSKKDKLKGKKEKEVVVDWQKKTAPHELSPQQKKEILPNLKVFYSGTPKEWEIARKKILAMGPTGAEVLAIFFIKFFGTLKNKNQDFTLYWTKAQRELIRLKEVAVPYVMLAMAHPNMGTSGKLLCSRVLVSIGKPSVPMLVKNLETGDHSFRRIVLETLGNIGDKSAGAPIASLYKSLPKPNKSEEEDEDIQDQDPFYGLRYYCLKALGKLRSEDSLDAIQLALKDPILIIRKKAVEASLQFHSSQALPLLQESAQVSLKSFPGYYRKLKLRIDSIQ